MYGLSQKRKAVESTYMWTDKNVEMNNLFKLLCMLEQNIQSLETFV